MARFGFSTGFLPAGGAQHRALGPTELIVACGACHHRAVAMPQQQPGRQWVHWDAA